MDTFSFLYYFDYWFNSGPIAAGLKGFWKTAHLYDNFPFMDMKTLFFGGIFSACISPFYMLLMPLYLLWFTLIRPFSSIHTSGNADWIQHLLQEILHTNI